MFSCSCVRTWFFSKMLNPVVISSRLCTTFAMSYAPSRVLLIRRSRAERLLSEQEHRRAFRAPAVGELRLRIDVLHAFEHVPQVLQRSARFGVGARDNPVAIRLLESRLVFTADPAHLRE